MNVFMISAITLLGLAWLYTMVHIWSDRVVYVSRPNGSGSLEISKVRKGFESLGVSIITLMILLMVMTAYDAIIRSLAEHKAFEAGWQPSFSCGEHGVVRQHKVTGQWERVIVSERTKGPSTAWVKIRPPPCHGAEKS
jgi:hypothetical protein